jgi:cobalt-zinc-cadmium efflux system protein
MHTHSHDHNHRDHTHDCPPGTVPTAAPSAAHSHSHSHGHGHSHHGHEHPPLSPSILGWAMVATLGLVGAEVVGGILGHSVALLNDAVHNLSDVPAIGLSYLAMRWAQRPADSEKTYGYHRAGTLAAFTNAVVLVLLSLWLGYESIERFRSPVEVVESWMIWTSLAALAVNGGITLALVRSRNDLNLRSILVHNFGDALSNVAIIIGAIIIGATGIRWIDPLLGLAIGLLVLWSSIGILRDSAHVLLEGRPPDCTVEDVARAVLTIEGVLEVHDIHIWSLGDDHNALSLHARIPDMHMDECERILTAIQSKCASDFNIGHATIQLERAGLPATSGYVMPAPAK